MMTRCRRETTSSRRPRLEETLPPTEVGLSYRDKQSAALRCPIKSIFGRLLLPGTFRPFSNVRHSVVVGANWTSRQSQNGANDRPGADRPIDTLDRCNRGAPPQYDFPCLPIAIEGLENWRLTSGQDNSRPPPASDRAHPSID